MLDDKYRIERLLAVGGMGAVYVGTHIKLRKRVAIKILNPQLSSPPMIERFHREAITASQIGHEGIAQTTDLGISSEGEPFLVMEYLEGESLASRLRTSGPLAIEVACELGCAILSPLNAAHHAGIVHRDLKPDNVFLVRQSRGEMVKLLDFGISRAAGLESEFRLTTTGLVLGTPYYMSPEQARGDSEITPAADLYAFGVMLYEMLVGHVPIQADNYNQLMYRVMTGDYAPPRSQRPDLPEGLEHIILGAMALAPEHRPASAFELERALLMFCSPAVRDRASGSMSSPALLTPSNLRRTGEGTPPSGSNAATPGSGAYAEAARSAGTQPDGARPRSPARWIIGLAIVVVGGVGAAIAVSSGGGSPAPVAAPAAPVVAAPSSAATTAPASSAGSAGGAPVGGNATPQAVEATPAAVQPATVTLRFAVEPTAATIMIDDAPVKGTEIVVRKDDAVHTLRITAPGRVAHEEPVRFDESQRLVVQLKRAAEPARGKAPPKDKPDRERIDVKSPY